MADCSVCCTFTHTSRMCVCKFCEFASCEKCTKRYVLELSGAVKCMSCAKPWSRKDLVDMFGAYFMNKSYKPRREELLFELEKALFPETQFLAVCKKNTIKLNEEIANINAEIYTMESGHRDIYRYKNEDPLDIWLESWDARQKIHDAIHKKKSEIDRLELQIKFWSHGTSFPVDRRRAASRNYKCSNEDCKGFLTGGKWTCDLCSKETCNKCHETIIGKDHACNPATVATVELLMKDSKNCPKCAATIYKISGCSQMYCTSCHTAFEWGTLEIVTGIIHNPHYYDWLRKNGGAPRQVGDIPCGGLPAARLFWRMNEDIANAHQLAVHVENVVIPLYRPAEGVHTNRSIRIDYMIDLMPLQTFKAELQKREKAQEKKREVSTIMNTFLVVASDIFRRILDVPRTVQGDSEFVKELHAIRTFTNETLIDNVSRVYKCVVPLIKENWQIDSTKA